ncbi:hypothetical protein ZWY2020_032236 [Hordeum vulgare]|nr:hypothetical protein ZWY2020_032236 [Hordeum vulgare]
MSRQRHTTATTTSHLVCQGDRRSMEMSGALLRPRFLLLLAAVFWVAVLYFRLSVLVRGVAVAPMERTVSFAPGYEGRSDDDDGNIDPCRGRRVYIHDLRRASTPTSSAGAAAQTASGPACASK